MANLYTKAQVAEARERLLELLSPGDTVHTVLRHVSRSGMCRWIDLYLFTANPVNVEDAAQAVSGQVYPTVTKLYLSGYVATLLGLSCHKNRHRAPQIEGCGMDMGFALVYDLAYTLWPKGANGNKDGGYALKQEWL